MQISSNFLASTYPNSSTQDRANQNQKNEQTSQEEQSSQLAKEAKQQTNKAILEDINSQQLEKQEEFREAILSNKETKQTLEEDQDQAKEIANLTGMGNSLNILA